MRQPIDKLLPPVIGIWKILRESATDYIDIHGRAWRMVDCECQGCGLTKAVSLANLKQNKTKGCKSCHKG